MKKLLEEKETSKQIVKDARCPPNRLPGQIHQSISQNFLRKIRLIKKKQIIKKKTPQHVQNNSLNKLSSSKLI